jgi:protein-tyrosine phosphatase
MATFVCIFTPFFVYPILLSQLNFRDLGGISATGGRKIRPGLLFRSGDLHSLSDDDVAKLEALGLATIVDLRASREIEKHPDRNIATVRSHIHLGIHDTAREVAEMYLAANDAAALEQVLVNDYRRMVTDHIMEFRKFLELLATTGDLPLVYHCAAGKDRTGLATVFLLTALGADYGVILEDYLATNEYNRLYIEKFLRKITETGLNGAILRPMLEVRESYLQSAINEIDRRFGGLNEYVEKYLRADIGELRVRFLQ